VRQCISLVVLENKWRIVCVLKKYVGNECRCFDCRRDEDEGEFTQTIEILDELGVTNVSLEDCRNVRRICTAVSERAAFLASAGVFIETACLCFLETSC